LQSPQDLQRKMNKESLIFGLQKTYSPRSSDKGLFNILLIFIKSAIHKVLNIMYNIFILITWRVKMKKIKKINTAKRVKVILEQDETLVSHGGGLLIDEFIHRLGLAQMIDSTVKVKERELGDFLRRFDMGHIRQLESVIAKAFGKVYASTEKMSNCQDLALFRL